MANLRRHFNFSTKPSLGSQSVSSPDSIPVQFDKHNLMKNICSCLDICCSYIQALNALCGAGSLLARSLLQTVQNVPVYQNVAQQFMCTWDEVGKATAGASAAVKTETLMVLQEVLNTLEMSNPEGGVDNSISDSFQVIGSCLHSFIELQAQFSMSTWKSLSKLSKSFSNDAFIHALNWKSQDRNALKIAKNSELCSTIKKHYSLLLHKYEIQKNIESVEVPQNQPYVPSGINGKLTSIAPGATQSETVSSGPNTIVWSPSTTLWSTSSEVDSDALPSSPIHRNKTPAHNSPSTPVVPTELDEVINLLSCMPLDQFQPLSPQGSPEHKGYDPSQPYQFWPSGSAPVLSRHLGHHRPWSEGSRDINFGIDSWIWRTDNMNCSDLPNVFRDVNPKENLNNSWDHNRWGVCAGESSSDDTSSNQGHDVDSHSNQSFFTSVRPRRYSSSDGLPDTVENLPDAEDRFWNVQNHKTSTWPLKQPSSRFASGFEWSEDSFPSKCIPTYFGPTS